MQLIQEQDDVLESEIPSSKLMHNNKVFMIPCPSRYCEYQKILLIPAAGQNLVNLGATGKDGL